jgi:hypothetical protein
MTIGRKVLAFFAPVDRTAGTPTVFDPAKEFDVDAPAPPWIAGGEVRDLKRVPATKFGTLSAGPKGAVAAQFRETMKARVAFEFCTWGKLQMALSGGSQHMNVLTEDANSTATASGGAALSPVAVLSGSSAEELILGLGSVEIFGVGDVVAADLDYMQQTGYIGSPACAYVNDPAEVNRDRDYLRRVTFNVAKVKGKTATSLLLDQPMIGGVPAVGASVQKVSAFVDREGGTFFQEWSGLFVVEAEEGGRACFYYPRLQAAAPASEGHFALDKFAMHTLHAEFTALPVLDENDGETVVCFRSWIPDTGAQR